MYLIKISDYQGLLGALIGGGFALSGSLLSNWLPRVYEKKAKLREAKSRIISNVIMQYRNIEKATTHDMNINKNKHIIVGINKGIYTNSSWSLEQLERNNVIMAGEIELSWKENNQFDSELVQSLAILQAVEPKTAKKISDLIYFFITWQAPNNFITEDEVNNNLDSTAWESFTKGKLNISLEELKVLHNKIVSALGSPQLMKKCD